MHLSWKDYESLASQGAGTWRDFVRYPHLLVCARCRRELKEHRENRALLGDFKVAYLRGEAVHKVMMSTGGGSRRT